MTLLLASLISLVAFISEILFALSLQSLIAVLGGRPPTHIGYFQFGQNLDLKAALILIVGVSFFRSSVQWMGFLNSRGISRKFHFIQSTRIVAWIFGNKAVGAPEAQMLMSEKLSKGSEALGVVQSIFTNLLLTFLLLSILLSISIKLALLGCFFMLTLLLLQHHINGRLVRHAKSMKADSLRIMRTIHQSMRNLLLIRIHNLTEKYGEKTSSPLRDIHRNSMKVDRLSAAASFLGQIYSTLTIALVIYFTNLWMHVSTEELVVFTYLFLRFSQRLSVVATQYSDWAFKKPYLWDLYVWYNEKYLEWKRTLSAVKPPIPLPMKNARQRLGWRLSKVTFGYPNSSWLFRDLDLEIEPGAICSFSGPSGIGKSTLLQLMLGELAPSSGKVGILMKGRCYDLATYRSMLLSRVGYAGPEPYLIAGSIYENLMFGLEEPIAEDFLNQMIDIAECQFIYGLNQGIRHFISEQGEGLSAGQKQRLCLLRALLRRPQALVLDEATSHLDLVTEGKILNGIKSLPKRPTMILISHRQQVRDFAENHLDLSRFSTAEPPRTAAIQ